MGIDLHYSYYTKKCVDREVLPYLCVGDDSYETWYNGKYVPEGFYDTCLELSEWNEENECWIFEDNIKLFEFASRDSVPKQISDYITNNYNDKIPIFIIWKR